MSSYGKGNGQIDSVRQSNRESETVMPTSLQRPVSTTTSRNKLLHATQRTVFWADRVHEYSWKKRCGICFHIVDTCSSHTVTSLCTVITCCLTLNVKMPTNVNVAILPLLFTIYNAIYGMTERFCSRSLRQIFLHVTYHSLVLFPQLLHNRCLVSSSQWKEGCTLSL